VLQGLAIAPRSAKGRAPHNDPLSVRDQALDRERVLEGRASVSSPQVNVRALERGRTFLVAAQHYCQDWAIDQAPA